MHVCYLTVDGTHRHMNFECIAVNRNYLSLDTNKPNRILFSERKINDNKSLMIFPPFFAVCSFRSRRRMHQVVCQVFENLFLLISSFSEFDDFTRLVFVSFFFFSHFLFDLILIVHLLYVLSQLSIEAGIRLATPDFWRNAKVACNQF